MPTIEELYEDIRILRAENERLAARSVVLRGTRGPEGLGKEEMEEIAEIKVTITNNRKLINAYAQIMVEKEQQLTQKEQQLTQKEQQLTQKEQQLTQEKRMEAAVMEIAAAKELQVTQEKRKEAVEMDAALKFEPTGETSGFSFLLFLSCCCQNAPCIYYLI